MTVNGPSNSNLSACHRLQFFSIPWTGQFDGIPGLTTFWNQVLSTHSFNEVQLILENRKFRSQAETSFS